MDHSNDMNGFPPVFSARFSLPAMALGLAVGLVLVQCATPEEDQPPVADAGEDLNVMLSSQPVTLDGSRSLDPEGDTLIYTWTFESMPQTSTLTDASFSSNDTQDAARPSFLPDVTGYYSIRLTVHEEAAGEPIGSGGTDSDAILLWAI